MVAEVAISVLAVLRAACVAQYPSLLAERRSSFVQACHAENLYRQSIVQALLWRGDFMFMIAC
jgi:hypothetical protein